MKSANIGERSPNPQKQSVSRPPVKENLDLFRRMRAGEFEEGSRVLRARIDMASGNINMRIPSSTVFPKAHHPRGRLAHPNYDFAISNRTPSKALLIPSAPWN